MRHPLVAFLLVAALGMTCSVVRAQGGGGQPDPTGDDKDAVIIALQERILELEAQLLDAQRQIESLERELQASRSRASDSFDFDEIVKVPDNPMASPDALFVALQKEYNAALSDMTFNTPREKTVYLRHARSWRSKMLRKYNTQVHWVCELEDEDTLANGDVLATFVVRDPKTGDAWSRPFVIELNRRMAQRVEPGVLLSIKGAFRAEIEYNQERSEEGLVNDPMLVGPFIEFAYEIQPRSIGPYEPDETDGGNG